MADADTQFGVYLEHGTYDGLIQGNTISRVHLGIDIEWWYGGQGSQRQTIRRNVITGAEAGINVDVGADGNTIDGRAGREPWSRPSARPTREPRRGRARTPSLATTAAVAAVSA